MVAFSRTPRGGVLRGKIHRVVSLLILLALVAPLSLLTHTGVAHAASYYVSPSGNDSNAGTLSAPWRTLQKAANTAQAGDTVFIRAGTYTAGFSLPRSGSAGRYITFSRYNGEAVTINLANLSGEAAFNFGGKSYIVFDGLIVDTNGSGSWIEGWSGMHHNIIRNCQFRNAAGGTHAVGLMNATYNQFIDNQFYRQGAYSTGGTDIMKLHEGCDYNLIQGNRFEYSEHSLFTLQGSYNVVRDNYFENQWEKNSETNGVIPPTHNVWDANTFATTKLAGDGQDSPGIQFSGPSNIVRHNVFYQNQGGGLRPEGFPGGGGSSYSTNIYDNRFYNNVFYKNQHAGAYMCKYETAGVNMSGNVFKNNIFFKNYHHESTSNPQQIYMEELSGLENTKFLNNDIIYQSPGADVIGHDTLGNHPLSWWQSNYSGNFSGNIEAVPDFVDEAGFNFELKSGSQMIDKGAHLARTTSSGSGTQIPVDDAGYFFDGYGIVEGDQIKVGGNSTVRITDVNYGSKVLTVDRSISWNNGDGVSLPYSGALPDIGAKESSSSAATATPTATATKTTTPTATTPVTPTATSTAIVATPTATLTTPMATATATATAVPATATATQTATAVPATAAPTKTPTPAGTPSASGKAYYVSPTGNDSNPGTVGSPWRTLQKAANAMQAGDTTYVRAGTYTSSLSFPRSGVSGRYITFAAYPGEAPTINLSNLNGGPAFNLGNRSYIVLDGLTVDVNNTGTWLEAWQGMHHVIVRNCKFREASSGSHGVGLMGATYNKFQNNSFYDHGSDANAVTDMFKLHVGCDRNLIEGNRFEQAENSLLTVQGSYNIIRNNTLKNSWDKSTQTDGDVRPLYNLWEGNTFSTTQADADGSDSAAMQFSGPESIVRMNVFYGNQGGSFRGDAFVSSKATQSVTNNRVYNNVFYKSMHAGIWLVRNGANTSIAGNLFKNNILFKNVHHESTSRPQQISINGTSGLDGNGFFNNDIIYQSAGANVIGHDSLGVHNLPWWQSRYASSFSGNLESDPQFVSESAYDFHLKATSPLIDKGAFLTKVASGGSGAQIRLEDARYFSDGFGIAQGDQIVVGNNSPVRITAVDYAANTVTVDRSITWAAGSTVSLPYLGSGPDIGAFELGGSAIPAATDVPTAPTFRPTAAPDADGMYHVYMPLVANESE